MRQLLEMDKDKRNNVLATTITSYLTDLSNEMLVNLLPLFLQNVLGAEPDAIGLIEGVAETTASLFKMLSGIISDKFHSRKWLATAGYVLSGITRPFYMIVSTWPGVLLIRFVDRIGKGIRNPPRDALIADSVDEKHRGIAFGFHRAGDTFGALSGMVLALIVVLITQGQARLLGQQTFQILALISIIPATLAVIMLALGAKDVPFKPRDDVEQVKLGIRTLGPRFGVFIGIIILFTLGNSSDGFLALRAQERGLNIAGILGMLITFNLVYSVISGPSGALSDRVGRRRLIIMGWAAYALVYLGFGVAQAGWQVWAVYAFYGLYYGLVEGNVRALIADVVLPEQRGTAYAAYNAAVGVVALPANLIAGFLYKDVGPAAPFLFGAALAIASVIAIIVFSPIIFRKANSGS